MFLRIPVVELADHRDVARIRRPHREARAAPPVGAQRLCAQATAELAVPAFGDQVQVEFAEFGRQGRGLGVQRRDVVFHAASVGESASSVSASRASPCSGTSSQAGRLAAS
jgi:hypothetical protein